MCLKENSVYSFLYLVLITKKKNVSSLHNEYPNPYIQLHNTRTISILEHTDTSMRTYWDLVGVQQSPQSKVLEDLIICTKEYRGYVEHCK